MSESKEDIERRIHVGDLKQLAREFRAAAGKAADVADQLEAAAASVQKEHEENLELRRQLAELQGAIPKKHPEDLTILVSESGKMAMSPYAGARSPLDVALEAALKLSKSGTYVKAAVWGRKDVRRVELEEQAIMLAAAGAGSNTGFSSVIDYMSHETSLFQEFFNKPQHFVIIISDGKKIDPKENPFFGILSILNASPKTTIDFITIGKVDPEMREFAQTLKTFFSNRVNVRSGSTGVGVYRVLKDIAEQRLGKPEKEPEPKVLRYPGRPRQGHNGF